MSLPEERWMARRGCYHVDPEATPHDLLNDATEWLQYARGLTEAHARMSWEKVQAATVSSGFNQVIPGDAED